jgi:Dolichyl-phosphate-mannose-protein mannosyltransferase
LTSRYAAWAAIIFIYVALRLPGIDVPLDRDEGAFGHMGQMILQGGLPYRDGLDHKPPVAFYINAAALVAVPATARGVHVFLAIYNFLTLVCLFFLARVYFDSERAGLWCAFCYGVVSASPAIQGFTASTEMWALLPISASLLFAVLGVRRGSWWFLILSGAAGAVACWTKQTMVTSIAFVLLYAAVASGRAWLRSAVLWMGSAVAVSGLIVSYFWAHGILGEFIYWCFTYGFVYAKQVSLKDTAEDLRSGLAEFALGNLTVLTVGVVATGWALWRGVRRRRYSLKISSEAAWAVFALGFVIFSLTGTIPGFAYRHYFAQLAPAVALAGGQGFRLITGRLRGAAVAVACGLAVIAAPVFADHDYFFERDPNVISRNYFGENPFPESKPVAEYIAGHTAPEDRVLIVGSEPQILFYAKRRSPSPFLMIYPLLTKHARYEEFERQMQREVEAHPPKYIVAIAHIPTSLLVDEGLDPEILKYLTGLFDRDYTLERVRMESEGAPDGEWVSPDDSRLEKADTSFLAVFRRKE